MSREPQSLPPLPSTARTRSPHAAAASALRALGDETARRPKVGYVTKRYPRYSETFIVNEILAHEAVGLEVEIFSLSACTDAHFQDSISRVRAPVTYLLADGAKAADFWQRLQECARSAPGGWAALECARGEQARDVQHAMLLAQAARDRGITHLHAHFASVATTVARLAARFAGLPYTFTAHAKDIFHESVRPDDLLRKLADAQATVTVSDFNLNHLRDTYGPAAAARVCRVYNGMDLAALRYDPPADRPPLILGVGRLVEKKGFADLIDACAILAGRGKSFRCLIVGTGELDADLRAQVGRLGLGAHVELIGARPQAEVFALLRQAAVFAAPCVIGADSNRDGLPTVLLEAMALGTPCVSTDVTGIPEVLRDGETGLRVPQHDPAALAAAAERLMDDDALRVRLAGRARERMETDFDVHRNAAEIRRLFAAAAPVPAEPAAEPAAATGALQEVA